MPPADESPSILEEIREHEARLGDREEAVWLALNDAAEERAEVLAFAADVLARVERLPEQRAGGLDGWRRQLSTPPGPVLDSAAFERSVIDIRRDAVLARRARSPREPTGRTRVDPSGQTQRAAKATCKCDAEPGPR